MIVGLIRLRTIIWLWLVGCSRCCSAHLNRADCLAVPTADDHSGYGSNGRFAPRLRTILGLIRLRAIVGLIRLRAIIWRRIPG
jgi:hypothetical protein